MDDARREEEDESESEGEERVVQWLQALDLQVVGACRSDERLMPMLKVINASNGLAEDRLLAHLCQHFEAVEVGMLARCFCIPLVSVRAGRIDKQGSLLCPISTRGNLNLTVLPTSGLRLSFSGDDGHTERLFTLSITAPSSAIQVNEIATDNSGRSFLIKTPDGKRHYFWCAEKSKLLGLDLLAKMRDFLVRRPSIAELTGISESRLGCFATHLRAYLVGSAVVVGAQACSDADESFTSEQFEPPLDTLAVSSKSVRSRHPSSMAARANLSFQGSLSPRSSSFKEGMARNMSSLKTVAREKLRRRGDTHMVVENLNNASADDGSSSNRSDKVVESCSLPISCVDSLGTQKSDSHVSLMGFPPLLSPYYCFSTGSSQLPQSSLPFPFLPPLSSLLPATLPSPSASQIPTFTPLICDPIVHIPVINVCSSGPGYLVSTGPSVDSLLVEQGARETLRLLINGSSQTMDENPSMIVAASRALFSNVDVDVIANRIAAIGLVSRIEAASALRCDEDTATDTESFSDERTDQS